MKKIIPFALALVFSALAAGCASTPKNQAMLTFETAPEGATIYEGGVALGVAPYTRIYTFVNLNDILATPEVTAVWPSGAKMKYWTNIQAGADLDATINRPANAPDLAKDLEHSKKFVEAKVRLAQSKQDALARDIKRNSARCKQQQSSAQPAAINDCN